MNVVGIIGANNMFRDDRVAHVLHLNVLISGRRLLGAKREALTEKFAPAGRLILTGSVRRHFEKT